MNILILLLFYYSSSWSLTNYNAYDGIPDHAPLARGHDHVIEDFLNKSFKTNDSYDSQKVELFLNRLRIEKKQLLKEMAEAAKLESLELRFTNYEKADEEYTEALDEVENQYAMAYTKFLEPTLMKAKERIDQNAHVTEIDSLMDSFISIYYGFFRPGIQRNIFSHDKNPFINFKQRFKGFRFSKKEPIQILEANNLEVGTEHKTQIELCLGQNLSVRHLLSQDEIVRLKMCRFDISKLNPGKSTYWTNTRSDYYEGTDDLFPNDNDQFVFTQVKYSGAGSLKLDAKVERKIDGKKIKLKYKLKLGNEVPQEIISSTLAHKIGLHQDIMRYYPKVKLYLPKKMTYMELSRLIRRKYTGTMRSLETFVESRSAEYEKEQWLVLKNVIIEVKHPDKIPLDSYEIWGGDLPNRREFRGALAFFSWINLQDIRPDNVRFSIVKRKDGTYAPEYSIQDTGQSLGLDLGQETSFTSFRKFLNMLRHQGPSGKTVNSFLKTHMDWNENSATFNWYEPNDTTGRFKSTTYSDVRWMARQIAKLTFNELSHIIRSVRTHEDEQTLYILKLANRRNEMVQAFELESEFPLFEIPDLDTYSPNANIKNGRIAVASLPGTSKYQQHRASLWPQVLGALGSLMNIPLLENSLKAQVKDFTLAGNIAEAGLIFEKKDLFKNFSVTQFVPGIRIYLNREVGNKSNLYSRNDGTSSGYYVKDTFRVEINLAVGRKVSFFTGDLPMSLSAKLKAWSREFTHLRPASSLQEAYRAPVRIFQVMTAIEDYASLKMGPEEIVSVGDGFGFETGISTDLLTVPLLKSGASISTQWRKSRPVHFYRDTMGQLHTYLASVNTLEGSIALDFLNLNYYVDEYPIIGLGWTGIKNKVSAELYTFLLPVLSMTADDSVLTAQRRKLEFRALKNLLAGDIESPLVKVRKNAEVTMSGINNLLKLHFLGIFHFYKNSQYSRSRINYLEEGEKVFHRYFYSNQKRTGLTDGMLGNYIHAPGVIRDKSFTIDVQMEEGKPREGVAYVNVVSYRPKFDHDGLLNFIGQQSKLYARNDNELFYRDMSIPSKDEVNNYQKLYAHHRIYISAIGVLDYFPEIPNKELKKILKEVKGRNILLFKDLTWLRMLKKQMVRNKDNHHKLVKIIARIIKNLNPSKTGSRLMSRLFGQENVYVMGDIIGINSSINHMQNHNLEHDRRFAGTSWGKFPGQPPIRKYLIDKELAPLDHLVTFSINNSGVYGDDPDMDYDKW